MRFGTGILLNQMIHFSALFALCQAYLYNLTSRCTVLLQLLWWSHVVLEALEPGRALLVYSMCCIMRSVFQLCVGASRLAGGGGVKSLLPRERW